MEWAMAGLFGAFIVFGVIAAIVAKTPLPDTPGSTIEQPDAAGAIDFADGWDKGRQPPHGWLMPMGVVFIIAGVIGSVLAWNMSVEAPGGYSGVANMDAIGYRTMLFMTAISTVVVGWLLVCTSLIVAALARFRCGTEIMDHGETLPNPQI